MPLSTQLTAILLLSPLPCPQVLLSLEATQQPQQQDGSDAASLAAALTLSSPVLANLQREAALMAALRHPNCVQLFGVCTFPPAMVTGALRFWLWFGPGLSCAFNMAAVRLNYKKLVALLHVSPVPWQQA